MVANENSPDGTYYAYFPFGELSLTPQIAAFHNKLLEPAFEFGDSSLRYYYALGSLYNKVEGEARAKPHGNILHGLA